MDIAALGLAIDSSQAERASFALSKLTAAAKQVEVATAKASYAQASAAVAAARASDTATKAEVASALAIKRKAAAALEVARATAAQSAAERAVAQASRTAASAADAAAAAMRREADAATRTSSAVMAASRAAGAAKFNTSNIASQFQDIAVSAQMGMGALQIGLQQGTQLAAVISTMENPLKGLGAAFVSVLSPVSLLVISFTALAAAGLQTVNWASVAHGALGMIADGLEVIAPYAALAAGGLALLYAPAIIGGLATAVASLGSVATAVWGVATAIYATVGLPALLVAGFVAMVAAAVVWRDDLKKMLGFDIVKAAQDGINTIIGVFVGAFNSVRDTWGLLPVAFSDIFTMAMNGAIDIVQNGVNGIIGPINNLLSAVHLSTIPVANLSGFKGKPSGAAGLVGDIISKDFESAQGVDYVGKGVKFIQGAASAASAKLKELANSIDLSGNASKKAAKEAERQVKAYDDIVRGANQHIAASALEASTLGMTTEQINAQKYAQDLLNKAANDNITLTGKQKSQLTGLGAAMAAAEATTQRLVDIYDFGKDAFQSFFNDLKSGIEDGKSAWESLGNAGVNALNKIADKALSMAADGLFDMIFGAISSGLTGGMGGGAWGQFGGFSGFKGSFGIPGFATGADFTVGGRGGIDTNLVAFRATAGERVTVTPANSNAADANSGDIHITVNAPNATLEGVNAIRSWVESGSFHAEVRRAVNRPGRDN